MSAPSTQADRTAVSATPKPSLYRRAIFKAFRDMPLGRLRLKFNNGQSIAFGAPEQTPLPSLPQGIAGEATIHIKREVFFKKCVLSGDIGFAESYIDGDWDTPDLTAVIAWFVLNHQDAPHLSGSQRAQAGALNLWRLANRIGHLLRGNNRTNARRNISEHYDLSNDFFALWLDPNMMYSSAKWAQPDFTLEEAQREKNDALCRSLRLQPEDHVLEIGTGWGGWSVHAAKKYGCRVTSLTISQQQLEYAEKRIAAAGLSDRIEVKFCDYRDIEGTFDKIVSIEMMEAIGHRYLPAFTDTIARVLKPDGLVALQFITCPDERYPKLRKGVDFIQKHIFPGSLLLSLNRVNAQLTRAGGFGLHAIHDMGPDYARTLRTWHDSFHAKLEAVRRLGFDERFIRKWSYYLCYCEAAFALRHISVVQTLHTRPDNLAL